MSLSQSHRKLLSGVGRGALRGGVGGAVGGALIGGGAAYRRSSQYGTDPQSQAKAALRGAAHGALRGGAIGAGTGAVAGGLSSHANEKLRTTEKHKSESTKAISGKMPFVAGQHDARAEMAQAAAKKSKGRARAAVAAGIGAGTIAAGTKGDDEGKYASALVLRNKIASGEFGPETQQILAARLLAWDELHGTKVAVADDSSAESEEDSRKRRLGELLRRRNPTGLDTGSASPNPPRENSP